MNSQVSALLLLDMSIIPNHTTEISLLAFGRFEIRGGPPCFLVGEEGVMVGMGRRGGGLGVVEGEGGGWVGMQKVPKSSEAFIRAFQQGLIPEALSKSNQARKAIFVLWVVRVPYQ